MDRSEFRKKALEASPGIPSRYVEKALGLFERISGTGQRYQSDLQGVYELANELARPAEVSGEEPVPFDIPSVVAMRDEMLLEIEREVRELRQQLFGRSEPPFDDYVPAMEWLEEEARTQPNPSEQEEQRWREIDREIMEKCCEASQQNSWFETTWRTRAYYIDYLKVFRHPRTGEPSGSRWKFITVSSHSRLRPLAQSIERLSKKTGFDRFAVLRYILVAKKPDLAPASLQVQQWGVERPSLARIVVTLNTPHLTWEHFQCLHRQVKDAWREALPHRTWPLTKRDLQIRDIVAELGGEPDPPCRKEFWERARKRCKEKGIEYKNWWGPLRAWKRYKRRKLPEPPEGWTEDDIRKFELRRRRGRRAREDELWRFV